MGEPRRIGDVIAGKLEFYLGAHTAKIAVKTFAQRSLGRGPETLTVSDLPLLIEALRPMMNTLIGKAQCELIVGNLRSEFKL
jgi:hypothetical protein